MSFSISLHMESQRSTNFNLIYYGKRKKYKIREENTITITNPILFFYDKRIQLQTFFLFLKDIKMYLKAISGGERFLTHIWGFQITSLSIRGIKLKKCYRTLIFVQVIRREYNIFVSKLHRSHLRTLSKSLQGYIRTISEHNSSTLDPSQRYLEYSYVLNYVIMIKASMIFFSNTIVSCYEYFREYDKKNAL